jgi:hypothetical protein
MIIEYYHLISMKMNFVIKHHQQLKQVHNHLIDDENHSHLLLNPNNSKKNRISSSDHLRKETTFYNTISH